MALILGVQFNDLILPLIEKINSEADRLRGAPTFYPVGIPELRGAMQVPSIDNDAGGVFVMIRPTLHGATVKRGQFSEHGRRTRKLTKTSLPGILSDLAIWISDTSTSDYLATKKGKNPKWTREELILALDLYFKVPPWTVSRKHPAMQELSQVLGLLDTHKNTPDPARYRNANGVYMKLMNLRTLDPSQGGKGLSGGAKILEREIWDEFSDHKEHLSTVAAAIRSALAEGKALELLLKDSNLVDNFDGIPEAKEGGLLTRIHRVRERNQAIVRKKKAWVLQQTGELRCEACGFLFRERYGDLGQDFIECHHTKPLYELKAQGSTRAEDLALVCANCHRMLHRQPNVLTIAELRSRLQAI